MTRSPIGCSALIVVCAALLTAPAAAQSVPKLDSYDGVAVRILQSNNAGTTQHVIDPAINEVVGIIRGCPNPHNLTSHPEGLYYYCSNELDQAIDVFDTRTLEHVTRIPLSARPNKIAVNKKHRKIYAGIAQRTDSPGPGVEVDPNGRFPAVVDVIDIDTHTLVKSIQVFSTVHNVFMTPDEQHVVLGLRGRVRPGDPTIQVLDPATDTVAFGMELTGYEQYGRTHHEVRPMAFLAADDGSTKTVFAQATGINAVWVLDWESREVVDMLWPHARPRGAPGQVGGVGVEPTRQPHLWLEPARHGVHRERKSGAERQLDDVDPRQPPHVRGGFRDRSHPGHRPRVTRDRGHHQDRLSSRADQHRDPAAGPRES